MARSTAGISTSWQAVAARIAAYAILTVIALVDLYPLFWMVMSSFRTTPDLFARPWALPESWKVDNFVSAWVGGAIGTYVLNSVKVTTLAVGIMVLFGAMAAYGIVRRGVGWAKPVLFFFLAGQMLPAQVVIIPLFLELEWFKLVNSHYALICVYVAAGLPFTVFLLQGFFRGVPQELYDAAVIDGLDEVKTFRHVALPLVKPGLAAAVIFQSLWVWNEFLIATIVLRRAAYRTIPIGLWQAVVGWIPQYNLAFSALTMVTIPVVIVFSLNQRHFVRGLTEGSIKA
jgi:raffinose/stachyose/melibiose transport system permease protein